MPWERPARGDDSTTGEPLRRIVPESGWYNPQSIAASVLLPAPFSPSNVCTSPGRTSKSTSSFASTPGKRFVMFRAESALGAAPPE